MYADDLFDGRVALVTGAGRGIGEEIALTLAELGADVAVNDVYEDSATETVAEIESLGRRSTAVVGDVSDPGAVETVVEEAEAELGLVRHVVNNAGANSDASLVDLPAEEWDRVMAVNARGTFLVSRAVVRRLLEADETGSIANVASVAGFGPQPGTGAYSPSKATVVNLTEQMALEWATDGVRVNAIAPGLIWTPASDVVYSDDDLLEARRDLVPTKRIGKPADVARTAVYLLAPENRYTTGETAFVDGGWSCIGLDLIPGRTAHE